MDNPNQPTDEDKMIQKLTLHKKMIGWILNLLGKENIESERTYGNDAKGDIYYPSENDTEKMQKLVRELNQKYNEK
ncbi:MAG: hypothetical protein KBF93_13130 [Leptospiraceae bacterium]|nr:hypothetical protein [Leptospiraceae bacterium]